MTYHPLILKYSFEYNWSKKRTLDYFKSMLDNHEEIMNIGWYDLAKKLVGDELEIERIQDWTNCFSTVWSKGWEYNEQTLKVKKLFQEIVRPKELKLEDYL